MLWGLSKTIISVMMAILLFGGAAQGQDNVKSALNRYSSAVQALDKQMLATAKSRSALDEQVSTLRDERMKFEAGGEELDRLSVDLASSSSKLQFEAEQLLALSRDNRASAAQVLAQSKEVACQASQLACQYCRTRKSYEIGKATSFFLGLGIGIITHGGGGGAIASTSIW